MEIAEVKRLFKEVAAVDDDCHDGEVLLAAAANVARLQAWLDDVNGELTAQRRGGLAIAAARSDDSRSIER